MNAASPGMAAGPRRARPGDARPVPTGTGLRRALARRAAAGQRTAPAMLAPAALGAMLLLLPGRAQAQIGESTLTQPFVPQGDTRSASVGVAQRGRPYYDAIGVNIGAFRLFPRVETGGGATTNTYFTSANPVETAFVYTQASASLRSNWRRHALTVSGSTLLRGFAGEARRNEETWRLGATGRVDLGNEFEVGAEVEASRLIQNQLSGDVDAEIAALSRYRRNFAALRGQYELGRIRAFAVVDHEDFTFSDVRFPDGTTLDQSDRDRGIERVTAQVEYARTPSVSLYAQASAGRIRYDTLLDGRVPNIDSDGWRVALGSNFDFEERARGSIGIGYTRRDFRSDLYDTVSGLSVEARVEMYPTRLTTVTLEAQRVLQDSALQGTAAFWDNRVGARADHELLRNLILNVRGEVARQTYIGTSQRAKVYSVSTGARYMVSRRMGLLGQLGFNSVDRTRTSGSAGNYNEVRLQSGVYVQL
jgi:hypothetical protein